MYINKLHVADVTIVSIGCLTLLTFGLIHYFKHLNVTPYDYMKSLDRETWKTYAVIRDRMEELHGGWLDSIDVHMALIYLEGEGLVEYRITPYVVPSGILKIIEFRVRVEEGGRREIMAVPCPPTISIALNKHTALKFRAVFFYYFNYFTYFFFDES